MKLKSDEKLFFDKQLQCNTEELRGVYPPHWVHLLDDLKDLQINGVSTIKDLGCGVGAIYKLLSENLPSINYVGYDRSEYAIELANKTWDSGEFYVKDCWTIDESFIQNDGEVLLMSALVDVMQDGGKFLEHVLTLGFKNILLYRAKITNDESHVIKHSAFGVMESFQYVHNATKLEDMLCSNYKIESKPFSSDTLDIKMVKK